MRIGLTILPEHPVAETRRRWAALEELGFDHGWTFDHLGWRSLADSPWFGTVPTLSVAALATSRLEIGPLVTSPNFRHPVVLARDVITLDEISEGRVTIGLGAGGSGHDTEVLGAPPPANRAARFEEFTTLLDRLLREDHVTVEGEYFSAVDARTLPGCRQRPRVPFVVAANGPRAMRLAATVGDGWVTTGAKVGTLDAWWAAVRDAAGRMSEALETSDRGAGPRGFRRFLQTDAAPTSSIASAACFEDFVGRAAELGFTDVVAPWPRADGPFAGEQHVVDDIAADVLPRWQA
ncbi:LLM class flavin-dependent oxidoreductase [Actinomycetospora aeridis]|uniref:LLM class flavin-dependent oxidoreductase n=1 Tax=Actinomycetospora aeridis TaxID=3129231 RepID=A0ABU8NB65_9PSEU